MRKTVKVKQEDGVYSLCETTAVGYLKKELEDKTQLLWIMHASIRQMTSWNDSLHFQVNFVAATPLPLC